MPDELEPIWERVREELRREVPDFKFHLWLDPLELVARHGDALFVAAPDHIRSWVRDRYLPLVRAAAIRGFSERATVEIVGSADEADRTEAAPPGPVAGVGAGSGLRSGLNPRHTFERFVIGRGNRFAHAAALAVGELPGQAYNPLFIHGRPGLGKTHLLHAIGNYVTRYAPALTVRYVTVEEFTTEFVSAVQARDTRAFKERFRAVDVLLLDDVQFLADKARTEEELFHTFNALHSAGRQLVMTSDRSPDELHGLEERLGERFVSGLVVGLDPPDLLVRRAILQKRARIDDVDAGADLIEEIAGIATNSVRALEAALIQVVAYASMSGEPATPALARKLLRRLGPDRLRRGCTVSDVVAATASRYGVGSEEILARDRRPALSEARKVAMFLARELTGQSLPEIGRGFGGRDHSTVLSAVRSVKRELGDGGELATVVDSVRKDLVGAG